MAFLRATIFFCGTLIPYRLFATPQFKRNRFTITRINKSAEMRRQFAEERVVYLRAKSLTHDKSSREDSLGCPVVTFTFPSANLIITIIFLLISNFCFIFYQVQMLVILTTVQCLTIHIGVRV
jgi:hypothetical protein